MTFDSYKNHRYYLLSLNTVQQNKPHAGPGQFPRIPSLPHLLLYVLVSFTFPFLTRFLYFLAFPSLPILPESSHSVCRQDVVGGD